MVGSLFTEVDTAPLVNGGSYVYKHPEGKVDEGLVLGVQRTLYANPTKGDKVEGNMYIFSRGPIPIHVIEGTESFQGWELVAAPAKSAASHHNVAHKAKLQKSELAKVA